MEKILTTKETMNQKFDLEWEMAIKYNIFLLQQIPKEIVAIGIFHALQITKEIHIYEIAPQFPNIKKIMPSCKKEISPWRIQSLQWVPKPYTEKVPREICNIDHKWGDIVAPTWTQPNEKLLRESFLLNKMIEEICTIGPLFFMCSPVKKAITRPNAGINPQL